MSVPSLQMQLNQAAIEGNEKLVQSLLSQKAEVNAVAEIAFYLIRNTTPLIMAAELGNRKVVDLLIAAKADVNYPPVQHKNFVLPPIYNALCTGKEEDCCMIPLLQNGADLMVDASSHGHVADANPLFSLASKCHLLGLKVAFTYSLAYQEEDRKAFLAKLRVSLLPFLHSDLIPIILQYSDTYELDLAQNAIRLVNHTRILSEYYPLNLLTVCMSGGFMNDMRDDSIRFMLNMGADPESLNPNTKVSLERMKLTKGIIEEAIVLKKEREQRDLENRVKFKSLNSDYELPMTELEKSVMQNLSAVRAELSASPSEGPIKRMFAYLQALPPLLGPELLDSIRGGAKDGDKAE